MIIWSTLYALRDDDGLESTLIRPVFDGMQDLDLASGVGSIALESGDAMLLESGGRIALEANDG